MAWEALSLDVDLLDALDLKDIVAIRKDEEAFARWRRGLERALREISRMPQLSTREARSVEAHRLMAEELAGDARHLHLTIEKSSFLNVCRTGIANMSVGVLFDALFGALGAGTASMAAKTLHDVATQSKPPSAGQRALMAHYVAFDAIDNQPRLT